MLRVLRQTTQASTSGISHEDVISSIHGNCLRSADRPSVGVFLSASVASGAQEMARPGKHSIVHCQLKDLGGIAGTRPQGAELRPLLACAGALVNG